MKIIVDMNLPPVWVSFLARAGHDAKHWYSIGAPTAPDRVILECARDLAATILTSDLDFGAILAATGLDSPSGIQLRPQDVTPEGIGTTVLALLRDHEVDLSLGSLISLDSNRDRLRRLPLR